jgi:hypothetical protein
VWRRTHRTMEHRCRLTAIWRSWRLNTTGPAHPRLSNFREMNVVTRKSKPIRSRPIGDTLGLITLRPTWKGTFESEFGLEKARDSEKMGHSGALCVP